ncbi:hypothetical protein J6590_045850 [Homalodisca vitripennis]|nr:hypothetical protein J6590_045850 [Homalodisca vitripennis]
MTTDTVHIWRGSPARKSYVCVDSRRVTFDEECGGMLEKGLSPASYSSTTKNEVVNVFSVVRWGQIKVVNGEIQNAKNTYQTRKRIGESCAFPIKDGYARAIAFLCLQFFRRWDDCERNGTFPDTGHRSAIKFNQLIGSYERRTGSGRNRVTTAKNDKYVVSLSLMNWFRTSFEVCNGLRRICGVDDTDFRHAIEELVSNFFKITLTGNNVNGTELLSQISYNLAYGLQMDVRECGRALENDVLSATFPLGRVSMVALSWFG